MNKDVVTIAQLAETITAHLVRTRTLYEKMIKHQKRLPKELSADCTYIEDVRNRVKDLTEVMTQKINNLRG